LSKSVFLKLNGTVSSARSTCFVAVLYLLCTDCSTVLGKRRTAVHAHQLSMKAFDAAM